MSESSKQLIIAISREFGSGGHVIAEDIADRFGLDLYDYRILQEIAAEKGMDIEELKRFDEKPFSRLIHRNINGYTNSVQDNIAQIEFDFMHAKVCARIRYSPSSPKLWKIFHSSPGTLLGSSSDPLKTEVSYFMLCLLHANDIVTAVLDKLEIGRAHV